MAQIRIETKPVFGTNYYHSYLVFVADDGVTEKVIRGGPMWDIPPFGPIVVEVGVPMVDSEDNRPASDRDSYGTAINLGGRDAEAVWSSMLNAANSISENSLPYNLYPTAQNSNSVVASVLQRVGIEMSDYFPLTSDPDEFHLGWDHSLEQVGYSIGTARRDDGSEIENDDILVGGARDDTLVGGLGADELSGRAGNDRLFAFLVGSGYETLYGAGPISDEVRDTLKGGAGFDYYFLSEHYSDYDPDDVYDLTTTATLEYDQILIIEEVVPPGPYSNELDFSIFDNVDVIDDSDQSGALYYFSFGLEFFLHIHFTSTYEDIHGNTIYGAFIQGNYDLDIDSFIIEGIVHQGDLYLYRIDETYEYAAGISANWMGIDAIAIVKNYTPGDLSLEGDFGSGPPGPADPNPTSPNFPFNPDFPDTADYTLSPESVTLNLLTDTATGGSAEGDDISGASNVIASNFDDVLTGDGDGNELEGGDGADVLSGGGGDDWLNSGDGDDTANGGAGSDILIGGSGNDQITGGLDQDFLIGGTGNDTYYIASGDGNDIINDDGDGDDDSLVLTGVVPANVTLSTPETGTLELAHGTQVITVKDYFSDTGAIERIVFDDGTVWDVAYVTSVINSSTNNAPTVSNAIADQSVNEDQPWSFAVPAASFDDIDGDTLALTAMLSDGSALPAWLSFDEATNTFSGTPPLNFNGSIELTVNASDGQANVSDTFTLTVQAVNDDPVASGDNSSAANNGSVIVITAASLLANDSDVDGDSLSIVSVQNAVQGSVALNVGGDIEFTPNAGYYGAASFTYTITDGSVQTTATVTLDLQQPAGTPNVIHGTSNADVITGTIGDDVIHGYDGNDVISGGTGADALMGGDGDDRVIIDEFDTWYAGDAGIDVVVYTGSANIQYGLDTGLFENAEMGSGNDVIWGSSDNNIVDGGAGDDTLHGYAGNDTLIGGAGADSLMGGDGDDRIIIDEFDTWYAGDAGIDVVVYTGSANIQYGLDTGLFENAEMGAGNDTIWGSSDDNIVDGGAGDDTLHGYAGNDTLIGGAGADSLMGGDGNDRIIIDEFDIWYAGDAGIDVVVYTGSANIQYGLDTGLFENAEMGSGNDVIWGSSDDNVIDGGAGDDTLHGYAGNDTLIGGAGADSLMGGDGNDRIIIDEFDTWYAGDAGIDVVVYNGVADIQYNLGQGLFENAEMGAGNDTIWGTNDANAIDGGAGNDVLLGYDGSDSITGGNGADVITGGVGNDTFFFASDFGHDTIEDFDAGTATDDVIEFTGVSGLAAYADVLAKAADDGTDTTITLDNDNSIVLKNVLVSELAVDDFRFV